SGRVGLRIPRDPRAIPVSTSTPIDVIRRARTLLARAVAWAARAPAPISVTAAMCVQATYIVQGEGEGRHPVVHLYNGIMTGADHGLPATDVPLREEVVPVHGIEVRFHRDVPR